MGILEKIDFYLQEQEKKDPVKEREKKKKEREKRQAKDIKRRLEGMSDAMERIRDTAAARGLPGFYGGR